MQCSQKSDSSLDLNRYEKCLPTIELAKNILEGKANVSMIEMEVKIETNISKPNVRFVFKGESGQIGFSVVRVLVSRFMESFGFATKMSDVQLDTLTVDTLENMQNESLEDIILFFKLARTGKFGATMRGVDSNLIYGDWFPKYLELKAEAREKAYLKEKELYKDDKLTTEDVKRAYAKLKEKENTFVDKVIAYVEKITEGINREQLEKLIEEWMNDPQKKPYVYHLNKKRLTIK